MAHISYSELKDWVFCAWYHKLSKIDKFRGFAGNEYTAFGNALHSVCESKLLKEDKEAEELFLQEFESTLRSIPDFLPDEKMIEAMKTQGVKIIPDIEPALEAYFGKDFTVVNAEEDLMVPIDGTEYNFKGFIDGIVKTADGYIHIFDWKTCSWGWDARKKADKMVNYQLVLYKHFYAIKHNIEPKKIKTHFSLLKRTANNNTVEFFEITSGPVKTKNALKILNTALYNIENKRYIKNRSSCAKCVFRGTEHCS